MSAPGIGRRVTEAELAAMDPAPLLAQWPYGPHHFAEAAIAAAIALHHLHTRPRSLTFLAEIVRRGGLAFTLDLPEPMPVPAQGALVREWLTAAASVKDGTPFDVETALARWFDAVAAILGMRMSLVRPPTPRGE
ncbi:hypothetical protein Cs7R123_57440 [Catellatospora sp. TT07R-123]|uniref:hypothetical protein n=1 Tax=Catellatospora sp. TT07R-123 TaxID=2733863 RepID=UPI001B1F9FBF|nr:hypothetical protein [Catellatospora sp. TT07R-123]GHJ48402.1 hypothetical protein Cs7R123_57440 [Catellatospora sp. TT07R-123]